jgi:predicted nucleotidyltransferase
MYNKEKIKRIKPEKFNYIAKYYPKAAAQIIARMFLPAILRSFEIQAVSRVLHFGSTVRGDHDTKRETMADYTRKPKISDIDLLVAFSDQIVPDAFVLTKMRKKLKRILSVCGYHARPIHIIIENEKYIARPKYIWDIEFYRTIQAEARILKFK